MLKAIDEQGKLTPDLARAINGAATKVELEDLYAPYKLKRRTKAQIAREAGLEPLSDALLKNPALDPEAEAAKFIDAGKGVADAKAALDGARHILIERIAETPTLVGGLREWLWSDGELKSAVKKGKGEEGAKFSDYFDFGQRIKDMPSHRALAMLRGMNEGILEPRSRRGARDRQAASGRGAHQERLRHRRSRPPGRRLARRDGAARLDATSCRVRWKRVCCRASRSAPTPRPSACSRAT